MSSVLWAAENGTKHTSAGMQWSHFRPPTHQYKVRGVGQHGIDSLVPDLQIVAGFPPSNAWSPGGDRVSMTQKGTEAVTSPPGLPTHASLIGSASSYQGPMALVFCPPKCHRPVFFPLGPAVFGHCLWEVCQSKHFSSFLCPKRSPRDLLVA